MSQVRRDLLGMTCRFRRLSAGLVAALAMSGLDGCATQKVWRGYGAYVEVVGKDGADPEMELKRQGLSYHCQTFAYSSYPHDKICYVERTSLEKVTDFSWRALQTPVAVVLDTGVAVTLVGVAVVAGVVEAGVSGSCGSHGCSIDH